MSLEERFWPKVNFGPDCWEWTGNRTGSGYGQLGLGRKEGGEVLTHRASWQIHFGIIPKGLCVCHRCDNKACVRPNHLFLGTYRENALDAVQKGLMNTQRGEKCGASKLTSGEVLAIRRADGTQKEIGKQFGIDRAQVSRIKNNLSWKHI